MCFKSETNTLFEIFKNFVTPVAIGFVSYIITAKLDDWKNRKKQSKLGESIMDSLIEEVTTGVNILTNFNTNKELPTAYLPNKSWIGISTINDEILLRIIEVSEDVAAESFPSKEIRIHCKNYFDMITAQWNANIDSMINTPPDLIIARADDLVNGRRFLEAATSVLKMLIQTKKLLHDNSNQQFPK